jgi:hypothetical protein
MIKNGEIGRDYSIDSGKNLSGTFSGSTFSFIETKKPLLAGWGFFEFW